MARKRGVVLLAMSGGVDSSVAAAILQKRGFEVVGVTMQIWQESHPDPRHGGCCSLGAVEDARRVARRLGIPHYVLNFRRAFADTVIRDFIHEYRRGRTPNPCVQCNRYIKFDALLHKADELGCDYIATGHYARTRYNPHTGRYNLLRAVNKDKDQSYVLYMLNQEQLRRAIFPLGNIPSKTETRRLATELGLWTANKPDSQEICFTAHAGGYHQFLRQVTPDAFSLARFATRRGACWACTTASRSTPSGSAGGWESIPTASRCSCCASCPTRTRLSSATNRNSTSAR
jgi:tRNA-specific 2-thiouridylase